MKGVVILCLLLTAVVQAVCQGMMNPMGMQRSMMISPGVLLQQADFKKELKLDKDQTKAIDEIVKNHRKRMDDLAKSMQSNSAGALAGFKAMEDLNAETDAKVSAVLTPEQKARFRELQWQCLGFRALYEEDLQKKLGLSESQLATLKQIQAGESSRMMQAMQGKGGAEMGKSMKKFREETAKLVMDVLTPEQIAAHTAALGKELKAAKRMSEVGM